MKIILALSLIVSLVFVANATAKGGPSSISIATLNGVPYTGQTPAFQDTITFSTTIPKLAGWQYPMIALTCYQDVNGDGVVDTSISGPDIVYSNLDHPNALFSFSGLGSSSIWSQRGGGAAICRADLDAYGWKGGVESVQILATTGDFPVN